jgi:hypothetical protein
MSLRVVRRIPAIGVCISYLPLVLYFFMPWWRIYITSDRQWMIQREDFGIGFSHWLTVNVRDEVDVPIMALAAIPVIPVALVGALHQLSQRWPSRNR